MTPNSVTTQPPYKLQMWPTHLLVAAALGVVALSVGYPSATRQYTWPWAPILMLIWLAPLVATFGRLAFRDSWTWPNSLLCTGLTLLTGATLLSATLSPFAQHSILRIWPTLGGAGLFFWLHDWLAESGQASHSRSQLLAKGLAGFGALFSFVSVIGWSWVAGGFTWSGRNDFPFGHSIYNAGAMVLILPWLTAATIKATGISRVTWAVATVTGFVALLTTSSRGGVVAVGTVGLVLAGCILFRATWSSKAKAVVALIAAIVLMLAVWSNPRLRELTHGQGWSEVARESNVQRNAMLEAGAKLGTERPLIGWGPGTIPLAYPQVRHQLHGGVDSVLQLHNSPAQIWATLGGAGVIALLLLVTAVARRFRQIAGQSSFAAPTLAAAASLLGYGLFALTDHQLDVPAMNAMLVINLALFFVNDREPRLQPASRFAKWSVSLATSLLLLVPLMLTGRDLLARLAYHQSLILFEAGRTDEGKLYLETAAERAPYDPYYRHQLAGRLLEQRTHSQDKSEQSRLTTQTISELERSLAAGCLQEFAHFNLGWLALETDEPARATPHFLATVHEAPHRGGAYLGLGFALQGSGHEAAAIRAYALEWINDPAQITTPLWEWPDFAPLRPRILHEADALLTELARDHPTAHYVREIWNWWETGASPPAKGFNAETEAFARFLAALARPQPVPSPAYDWGLLFDAWQRQPNRPAFFELTKHDEPFTAALAKRATRHAPPNWHDFLTAGLENEPFLRLESRFARSGYGVLALHPDGPVLTNLYVLQQNRVAATFAAGLFPPKGWIPASELLKRLPVVPAAP